MTRMPRLTRTALAACGRPLPAAPIRIVHIGVGAFHRTHQAWYTSRAADASEWGIAAFTGRSDSVVRQLTPQNGLFTVVERGPVRDRFEIVSSIVEVQPASNLERFLELVAAPATAIVTLTVTEAGYHLRTDGTLDLDDALIEHDIQQLRSGTVTALHTPIARLLLGLERRRAAGAGPLAVVSCDNLPDNGALLQRAIEALGEATTGGRVGGEAAPGGRVGGEAAVSRPSAGASFVSTSVDRITPHTLDVDILHVEEATGWRDEAAVVAEPFSDWTLSGSFPAGRPQWEDAGARIVDDIAPYERRKLQVLNGGHLVLAFRGLLGGHATVAEAMGDTDCRSALELFWSEAARSVGDGVDTIAYRTALIERFENPRIEHRLAQIAVDTVTKLRLRILPVLENEMDAGRPGDGSLAVIAAWAACARAGALRGSAQHPFDLDHALAELCEGTNPDVASLLRSSAAPGR